MYQPHHPPAPPAPPFRWGRFTAWTTLAAVAAFWAGGGLGIALKDDGPSEAACKTALAENYRRAMAAGGKGPEQPAPDSCDGLDAATLDRLIGEVVAEYLESPQAEEDIGRAVEEGLESAAAQP
jgi:hypothetical protein